MGQVLTFDFENERYGLDVDEIRELVSPETIKAVPMTPMEIRGLMVRKGRVITVLDLCSLLGFPIPEDASECRVAILREPCNHIGLLFFGEGQIVDLPAVARSPEEGDLSPFIKGLAKTNGLLYNVLSTEGILTACQQRIWETFRVGTAS